MSPPTSAAGPPPPGAPPFGAPGAPVGRVGSPSTSARVPGGAAAKVESVQLRTRLGVDKGAPNGHDKILELRAERHASAVADAPGDFDSLYAWALVLQEQAERAEASGADPARAPRAHLLDACDKYARAWALRRRSHATLYNWGIALGDLARGAARRDPAEARRHWLEACERYRAAVEADDARGARSAQALNNWGLALGALASDADADAKAKAATTTTPASSSSSSPESTRAFESARLLRAAVARFREAIRRDPTFHRAAYNLGTIVYALAERAAARGEDEPDVAAARDDPFDASRTSSSPDASRYTSDADDSDADATGAAAEGGASKLTASTLLSSGGVSSSAISAALARQRRLDLERAQFEGRGVWGVTLAAVPRFPDALRALAATYVAAACASDPSSAVYSKSLRVVRRALPLPHLAAGALLASPEDFLPAESSEDQAPRRFSEKILRSGAWTRRWFVLDHEALRTGETWPGEEDEGGEEEAEVKEAEKAEASSSRANDDGGDGDGSATATANAAAIAAAAIDLDSSRGPARWGAEVRLASIVAVHPCDDASLPGSGFGVALSLADGSRIVLVADSAAAREHWVDAAVLARAVADRGRAGALREELAREEEEGRGGGG